MLGDFVHGLRKFVKNYVGKIVKNYVRKVVGNYVRKFGMKFVGKNVGMVVMDSMSPF